MGAFEYNATQQRVLAVLPFISPPISALASSFILYLGHSKLRTDPYHRLIFGMSVVDIVSSVNFAVGNQYSCQLNALLFQLSVCGALYNLSLCLYYVLKIKFRWSEEKFQKSKLEYLLHGISICYPLLIGGIAIPAEAFNPLVTLQGWCYYETYPARCGEEEGLPECERGENYLIYEVLGAQVPLFLTVIGITACMIMIYRTVRRTEAQMARYATISPPRTAATTAPTTVVELTSNNMSADEQQRPTILARLTSPFAVFSKKQHSPSVDAPQQLPRQLSADSFARTRQAAIQAFLYTTAFVVTFSVPVVNAILVTIFDASTTHVFVTATLIMVLVPLQGVWNLTIYVRPRYRSLRLQRPDCRWWKILYCCLLAKSLPAPPSRSDPTASYKDDDDPDVEKGGPGIRSHDKDARPNHGNGSTKEACTADGPDVDSDSIVL